MVPLSPVAILQPSLDRLRGAVLEQNKPGSVDGLLARYILRDDSWTSVSWQVRCTSEWVKTEYRSTNAEHVAALGYSVVEHPSHDFMSKLLEGLDRVIERDAFKGEHLSLARSPSRLLGILLGALAVGDAGMNAIVWCRDVLEELRKTGKTEFDPLVQYLVFRAKGTKIQNIRPSSTLYELAFQEWAHRHQFLETDLSQQEFHRIRQQILFQTATDLRFESASQAAFIWESVNSVLFHVLGDSSLQAKHVAGVLRNFEAAMKRWRWDGQELQKPIRWPITQEREVQDILWLILRSYFQDVVDEDALPKFGHSTYKADFGIGSLKLIVEVKFTSTKRDFKRIEKEIQEDCIPYLRSFLYESLIVFIYDHSASVQEHDTTRKALLEIPEIVDVVIVSRPSQLPQGH